MMLIAFGADNSFMIIQYLTVRKNGVRNYIKFDIYVALILVPRDDSRTMIAINLCVCIKNKNKNKKNE